MHRSRLTKKLEQRTKKNLFLSILGIIFVFFLIFKFGIPFLANLSLFLSGTKGNENSSQNQNPSFIAAPILDPLPQATSSADIIISGLASKNQTVTLYINNALVDEAEVKENGIFSFKQSLSPGENSIKAKVIEDNKESDFSNLLTIALKTAAPLLDITSPVNGQSFTKDQNAIDITGTTDKDAKITVNGFWAITDDSGEFSYRLTLQNGENKIKVTAVDIAGNKKESEITVTYSP